MARPIVMSDEELYQLTGSWEAAAALRDEQYNELNAYNNSLPAAEPVAATVAAPAAVEELAPAEETAPTLTYSSTDEQGNPIYEPVYTPAAVAEPVYTPTAATPAVAETPAAGIASLIPAAAVEEPATPALTYTQTDEQGNPIYETPAVVAPPVAPVATPVYTPPSGGGKLDLEPENLNVQAPPSAPTGIAALAPVVTPSEGGVASLIKRPKPVEEPAEKPVAEPVAAPVAPPKETPATAEVAPTDKLVQQILGQNLTKKWTGEGFGSAEKNAADMAKILTDIGITDIKDFGKVTQYAPAQEIAKTYNGQRVYTRDNGDGTTTNVITKGTGQYDQDGNETVTNVEVPKDAKLTSLYGEVNSDGQYVSIDPSKVTIKDGQAVVATGETFGNKKTGQTVSNTYGERQTGNMFGGTYSGKGNTGYGVQFDEKGNPVFYTQGASSSDIGQIAPLLAAASFIPGLAPFAQGLNALIAAKSGNGLGALASLAGMGGFSNVAQAANVANSIKNKNVLGLVGAGANLAGVGDLNVGGVGLNDITKGIGAIKALKSNNPLALAGVASSYLGGGSGDSPDSDDFEEGYFLPGGEGYIAPSVTGTDEVDNTSGATKATTSTAANTTTGGSATDILKSLGVTNVDDLEDSGLSNDDLVSLITGSPVTGATSTTSTPAVTSTVTNTDDDITSTPAITGTSNTTDDTTAPVTTDDTDDDDTVDEDDTEDTTPAVTTKPVVKDDEVDEDADEDIDEDADDDSKDEEDVDEKDDSEEDKDTDKDDSKEDDEEEDDSEENDEEEEDEEEEEEEEKEEEEDDEDGKSKKTKIGKGGSKKSAKSKPSKTKAVRTPTTKVPKPTKTGTKPVTTGTKVTTPVKTTTPVKSTVTTTPTTPIKPTVTTTPTTTTTTTTPKTGTGGSKGVTNLPGGSKTTTAKPKTPTKNPAIDAITSLALKQDRRNALLNAMGGKNELAKIKSYEELYGSGLFGDSYVPPSARGVEPDDVREPETQDFEEEFFNGGHVDDQSIDALLHMLRN